MLTKKSYAMGAFSFFDSFIGLFTVTSACIFSELLSSSNASTKLASLSFLVGNTVCSLLFKAKNSTKEYEILGYENLSVKD